MSRNVAKPAVTTEKLLLAALGSTSQPSAPIAVGKQKFHLSPKPNVLSIAAIVSQRQGNSNMSKITKDTIIAEILQIAPNAAPLFQAQGMHCLGCGRARSETLAQACAGHGVDIDEMLTKLNALVAN
jgi:hybrid cluster-associated redox disulfide protein